MTEWDPVTLARGYYEHGKDWAEKKAAGDLLEETKKTLRAQLALKFLPTAGSAAKAEIMADASPEYEEHVKAMVEANLTASETRKLWDGCPRYPQKAMS